MDEMLLEKVDLIRERMNVSYLEARQALEQADGNVVEALVLLEKNNLDARAAKKAEQDHKMDEFVVKGNDLVAKVNDLLRQGNITRIKVLHEDNVLFEVPLTFGAAAVLVLPQLALLTGIAVLFARVTIQIEKRTSVENECDCGCCEEAVAEGCCEETAAEGCCEEAKEGCCEETKECTEQCEPVVDEENPH